MKKCISVLLVMIMSFTLCALNVSAENSPEIVNESEAKQLAILFVAQNINNDDMTWNNNTKIANTVTLYDEKNNITGYSVELTNNGTSNGYVVVSANAYDENVIKEFSSKAEPLYKEVVSNDVDKIYHISPLEYYVENNNKVLSLDGESMSTQTFVQMVENKTSDVEIAEFSIETEESNAINYNVEIIRENPIDITPFVTGSQGTSISNPLTWLRSEYSSTATWTNDGYGTLEPGITAFKQNDLEADANNCSITAIATVVYYYKHIKGYGNIDSSITDIYRTVRAKAVERGYTAEGGTDYWDIDNILTDTFAAYGYDMQGNNDYINLWNTIKTEITTNWSPVILSMTGGYYNNHTVTIVGWTQFKSSENNDIVRFLKVYDGWTISNRYIDYEKITAIKNITKVIE